jgi:hypothetical protein
MCELTGMHLKNTFWLPELMSGRPGWGLLQGANASRRRYPLVPIQPRRMFNVSQLLRNGSITK